MKPLNSSLKSTKTNETEDELLDKYFSEIKKENYDTSSIPIFDWIENASGITGGKYSLHKKSVPAIFFAKYKHKFALVVFLLIAVSIAMTVPVKQTQTVANVLSWKINKSDKDKIKKLDGLEGIDKNLLTVDLSDSNDSSKIVFKLILPNPDEDKLNKLQNDLESLGGIAEINLLPINESYNRPAFAFVLGKIFDVKVNTPNINEDEMRNNINQQLIYAGLPVNLNYEFKTSSAGVNMVNAGYSMMLDTIKKYRAEKNIMIAPDADEIIKQVDKMLKIESLHLDSLQGEINHQIQKNFSAEMMQSVQYILEDIDLTDIMDNVKEALENVKGTLNSDEFKEMINTYEKTYWDSLKNFNQEEYEENLRDYEEGMKDYEEGMKEYQEGMKEYQEGMKEWEEEMKKLNIDFIGSEDSNHNLIRPDTNFKKIKILKEKKIKEPNERNNNEDEDIPEE